VTDIVLLDSWPVDVLGKAAARLAELVAELAITVEETGAFEL